MQKRETKEDKFVIDVVSVHDFLSIVFDDEQELKIWLDHLLSQQKGENKIQLGKTNAELNENLFQATPRTARSRGQTSSRFGRSP